MELGLVILTSFFIVVLSIPALIKVSVMKRLFDLPQEARKLHQRAIPSMGGAMIFAGTLFSYSLWYPGTSVEYFKFIIPCILTLFFVGVKDDIVGTAAMKKLMAHLVVAFILVLMANLKLRSLHGIFEIREIPDWASIGLSVFSYIVIVNAFNLIDGIDGLAASVGIIVTSAFGTWFCLVNDMPFAVLAFSLTGALLGFLVFNFSPAKIFMGDSGSLTLGLISAILAVRLIEYHPNDIIGPVKGISKPIFAMAVLVYPLVDTLRVFIYRVLKGRSPFSADRNHLHHKLLRLGFNHMWVTLTVCGYNLIAIALVVLLRNMDPSFQFMIMLIIVGSLTTLPFLFKEKKNVEENS